VLAALTALRAQRRVGADACVRAMERYGLQAESTAPWPA